MPLIPLAALQSAETIDSLPERLVEAKPVEARPEPPRNSPVLEFLCRWRVKFGVLLAGGVIIEGLIEREPPLYVSRPSPLLFVGLSCILVGALIRLAALGTLRKNEQLATTGIYSIVRHPLYLGSSILFVGFATLMNDDHGEWWYLGLPYLAIFFSAAAIREERFLRSKFGAEFDAYKSSTPAILPLGRFRPGAFSMQRAMQKGGYQLIATVVIMLAGIEFMAHWLSRKSG